MADNRIDRYAAMAKLSTDEDREYFISVAERLEAELSCLEGIDTEGVEPLINLIEKCNVYRDDEALVSGIDVLANAPEMRGGCFVVPKSIE